MEEYEVFWDDHPDEIKRKMNEAAKAGFKFAAMSLGDATHHSRYIAVVMKKEVYLHDPFEK